MEPNYCPEISARSYHYTLRNKLEDRRSQIFVEGPNPYTGSRAVTFRPKGTQTDRQMDTTKIAFRDCVNPPKLRIKQTRETVLEYYSLSIFSAMNFWEHSFI
jgi:hypothetical protein